MKRTISFLFSLILISFPLLAKKPGIPVFISGTEGYKIFRIPAIIAAPGGELLAFAEGRVNGADDFGNIDIVLKRSTDHGKTWSKLTTIVDLEKLQAGNPAPVVDLLDPNYPKGRIFLFYNTGNTSESQVLKGNGCREVWCKTSVDEGRSWSEAENITLQVHKPNQLKLNTSYHFKEDWRWYANTPGHALQLSSLPCKGRIYVAANHSEGNMRQPMDGYFAHGFYTDDHGKSFKISANIPLAGSNESTAAELSNGGLMLNIRNQKGDVRARIVAVSKNGGESWDSVCFDHRLPDPVCEGSILNIGKNNGKNWLAFCNAADPKKRDNLTLRISYDEGLSWPERIPVDHNPSNNKSDYTAYSDIVKISNSKIGVLYEKDNYSQIVFKKIKFK